MPKHCAALPGASNELLGTSGAELATALLERFGFIPEPRDGGPRRHAAVPVLPGYPPKQRIRRTGRRGKPVMAAVSITAIGAVAAVTAATGQFASVAPARASLALSDQAPVTADPVAPVVAAPPVTSTLTSALQSVQVSSIVQETTNAAHAAAVKLAADRKAAAAAAAAKAKAAAAARVPRPTPSTHLPKVVAGAGVGAAALAIAESKIGKPYVWGASGPNAFDCSGLVMWAFKQAGVSLPRTSAAQSQVGTAVSKGDLRPGDLVFFYSPVSHVGIYVGDGKILNASTSGEPVKISSMQYMPFHNARRV
jgi:cell wall-associated NlpC family hydrolase